MPNEDIEVTESAEETETETVEETEGEAETAEETDTQPDVDVFSVLEAINRSIEDLKGEIASIKSMKIDSGAEVVETDAGDVDEIDEDPEPVSIDELDLTM